MINLSETVHSVGITGLVEASLIDRDSGLLIAYHGVAPRAKADAAAALWSHVLRAAGRSIAAMRLDDVMEDMAITLDKRIYAIRPLSQAPAVLLCLVVERSVSAGLARLQAAAIEQSVDLE